jgi:hypothetical protein
MRGEQCCGIQTIVGPGSQDDVGRTTAAPLLGRCTGLLPRTDDNGQGLADGVYRWATGSTIVSILAVFIHHLAESAAARCPIVNIPSRRSTVCLAL